MPNVTYATGNSANWELAWNGSFTAPPIPGSAPGLERYYPLEPQAIGVSFETELVAFYATSEDARESWHYAATISQKINAGLTVGGNVDTVVSYKKIFLNQITLLEYPLKYGSTYSLIVRVPYWIRQIELTCWAYTGPVNDGYQADLTELLSRVPDT